MEKENYLISYNATTEEMTGQLKIITWVPSLYLTQTRVNGYCNWDMCGMWEQREKNISQTQIGDILPNNQPVLLKTVKFMENRLRN